MKKKTNLKKERRNERVGVFWWNHNLLHLSRSPLSSVLFNDSSFVFVNITIPDGASEQQSSSWTRKNRHTHSVQIIFLSSLLNSLGVRARRAFVGAHYLCSQLLLLLPHCCKHQRSRLAAHNMAIHITHTHTQETQPLTFRFDMARLKFFKCLA